MAKRFRVLSESRLAELEPPAVLAYVHAARAADDVAAAGLALQLLMWRHRRLIRMLVAGKVPEHRVEEATDFCLTECAAAVVRNPPEAQNGPHFRGWLASVVHNQIVSWWRRNARHEDQWSLDAATPGEEEGATWDVPTIEGGYAVVEYGAVVDRQLDRLSETHRRVVELRVFDGLPSREVAERMLADHEQRVTPTNIDQIASRFRRDCRADGG